MPNLHDAIGAFIASIKNPQTAESYSRALSLFERIAPADLARVDETYLIPYLDTMGGKAAATKNLRLSAVISFFAFLIYTKQSGAVSLDRARMLKTKLIGRDSKRISNYPIKDLQTLVAYVKGLKPANRVSPRGAELLRDRALILTLAETGLRRAEVISLKISDVDFTTGQAVVIGKGDKQAVVYFGSASLQAVRDYIEARVYKSPDSPLFMRHGKGEKAAPLDGTSINKIVNKRAREVLGHGMSVHSLRHYFVTFVWVTTHDLALAKNLARHESVQTTMRYTHISDDQLRTAHREIFK